MCARDSGQEQCSCGRHERGGLQHGAIGFPSLFTHSTPLYHLANCPSRTGTLPPQTKNANSSLFSFKSFNFIAKWIMLLCSISFLVLDINCPINYQVYASQHYPCCYASNASPIEPAALFGMPFCSRVESMHAHLLLSRNGI